MLKIKISPFERILNQENICREKSQDIIKNNLKIKNLLERKSAIINNLEKIRSDGLPDLDIEFLISNNAITDSLSGTFNDFAKIKNPRLAVVTSLNIPLGINSKNKASYLKTYKKKLENELEIESHKKIFEYQYQTSCSKFKRLLRKSSMLSVSSQLKRDRISIEEKKFSYGESDLQNLIQAENDFISTKSELKKNYIKTLFLAWKITNLENNLNKFFPFL